MKSYFSKFYKSQNFLWEINGSLNVYVHNVEGPFCVNCKMDILFPKQAYIKLIHPEYGEYEEIDDNYNGKVTCSACGRIYSLSLPYAKLKEKVVLDYTLKERAGVKVESLDELPSQVKVRDQDDKYFLAVKIGEQNGRRVGVAYFGEKSKEQTKKDYSQIFIDLDDDQVRFDKSNKPPKEVIAKMKVEFPDSQHEETYNARKGTGQAKKSSTTSKRRTGDS